MELPFSFSLKGRGKKAIDFREKASGAAVFTPPYTPGAPMISLVWQGQKRKAGLSACTVVMPCEQRKIFSFSKRGLLTWRASAIREPVLG